MNILLIGGGGREHALAYAIAASPLVEAALPAPPAIPAPRNMARNVALDIADHAAVAQFCHSSRIGLVVVGPEAPLVAGIVDDLTAAGIKAFGPDQGGGGARRLQGLHQGSVRRRRHPDCRLPPLQGCRGGARPCRRERGAAGRQARRAGAGQGRDGCGDDGQGGRSGAPGLCRPARRCRGEDRDRGAAARARASFP